MSGPGREAVGPAIAGHTIAGRYRLDEPVGSGGMATVWSGTDLVLNRRVAIKVLHPHLRADPAYVVRFRNEATRAARVAHPGVVAVYDTAADDTAEAIVLEFVDGITLREHLDTEGRLPVRDVVELGVDLFDALDAAHRVGLIHRDIKPANILIAFDGTVKIADFGIAKGAEDGELTRDGTVIGTASYLAPEQLTAENVDARSDLFSTSVVLYEALCGTLPHRGDTETARALARLHQEPVPPSRLIDDVPPALDRALMSGLEREPAQRPNSAVAFRDLLAAVRIPTSPALDSDDPIPAVRREITIERPVDDISHRTPTGRTRTGRGSRESRGPRRRPKGTTVVLTVLIGGALVLLVLLAVARGSSDTSTTAPPATVAPVPPATGAVAIVAATPFDPQGTGDKKENNPASHSMIDGDPATEWTTEGYQQRTFGTKAGVGVLLTLPTRSRLQRLEIDTPTQGWSGQIFVLPGTAAPNDVPANPVATVSRAAGNQRVELAGRAGASVLLWITDLGNGPAPYRFAVSEVRLVGAP